MTDKDESILKTVQEVKMAKMLLLAVNTQRTIYPPEKCWLLHVEAVNILREFDYNTVRSFLDKLRERTITEYMEPIFKKDWSGVFRFTKEGEEKIKNELNSLSKLLSLKCFQEIIDTYRSRSR